MSLSDRSKSILLQVAYKGVVEGGTRDATADFKQAVLRDFQMLVGLHEELGLNPDDDSKPARKGQSNAQRRTANVEKAASNADAPTITLADGVEYLDYRGLKAIGAIENPKFPDFKVAAEPNKRGNSKWILRDGEPTEFAVENGLA